MDFKKIAKITGASIGSFLVMIIATYLIHSYMNAEEEPGFDADQQAPEEYDFTTDNFRTGASDSLQNKIEDLQNAFDSLKAVDEERESKIDSLNKYIAQLEQENEEARNNQAKEITAEDLKDVSRSLLNMEEDALKPILNQLSTTQLTGLYNSANNMQRAKLLRSVKPDKAATILNEVM